MPSTFAVYSCSSQGKIKFPCTEFFAIYFFAAFTLQQRWPNKQTSSESTWSVLPKFVFFFAIMFVSRVDGCLCQIPPTFLLRKLAFMFVDW